ncbi:uncharacterized protein EDB91DRAFT_1115885 [Suillus paluster]|uniref:uncharacterized protein n=1 Tax=Suillus paluster TaxID=48578 RepID=UPI001B8855DB|nr:uncharacterized protein EDB91DRAFT_1115885 [Suillus paluster]KAG1747988.1 hypothetical protein EDB91DRAFT_1115885 [Suillus paluster]
MKKSCLRSSIAVDSDADHGSVPLGKKHVAFGEEGSEQVFQADEWDRAPTEILQRPSYDDGLELKMIQRSPPRAQQPCIPPLQQQDIPGGPQPMANGNIACQGSIQGAPMNNFPPHPGGYYMMMANANPHMQYHHAHSGYYGGHAHVLTLPIIPTTASSPPPLSEPSSMDINIHNSPYDDPDGIASYSMADQDGSEMLHFSGMILTPSLPSMQPQVQSLWYV